MYLIYSLDSLIASSACLFGDEANNSQVGLKEFISFKGKGNGTMAILEAPTT